MGIFQKYLTGHPKGAAGAWMFNGCLQVLNSGLVPGNRNADNVDQVMEKFDYIVYPNKSIQTDGIKAFSVTSFGFGQKGAQAIGIHPKYLYAVLEPTEYAAYKMKVETRQKKTYRFFHDGMINNTLFVAKNAPPYAEAAMEAVFLNPEARAVQDKKSGEFVFPSKYTKTESPHAKSTREMLENLTKAQAAPGSKIGVDVEDISAINIENETFVSRNFTQQEVAYCKKAPSPQSSFAGRWSAKEAVFKSLGVSSKGAGAPLSDIEIVSDANGAPKVELHGEAARAAKEAGMKNVTAIAVAVAAF
ncbi:beta subunit of fatty acid synthetase [Elasticomyces elasticus]|nr:beta subunit of fatty acid synthetase [Elasticomyces elasticus]